MVINMATINISIPDGLRNWVQTQTDGEQYASTSDYLRDLIRKDQARQQQLQQMQDAISAGINSGEPIAFNADEFHQRMLKKQHDE